MKKTKIHRLFIVILLLYSTCMQATLWESMRDVWSKINKNTVALYKRQPALTALAATAVVSGLGLLVWRLALQRTKVEPQPIGESQSGANLSQVQSRRTRSSNFLSSNIAPSKVKSAIRFNKQVSLDTLADLPGLFQEELGEDHDWHKTAVMFRYEGALVHDTYNVSNGKGMDFLLYEDEGVNPKMFTSLRREYGFKDDSMLLPMHILKKYGYCTLDQTQCGKDYIAGGFVPTYIEQPNDVELGISELTTNGAFVGVYSKNHTLTLKEQLMVKELGIQVYENNWYDNFLGQLLDSGTKGQIDTYILVDNNQEDITQFIKESRKQHVNALGIFYTRPNSLVTIDKVRAEIKELDPNVPCQGAGISD